MGNMMWKVMVTGAALGAGALAHKVTNATWRFVTGADSPENPEDPDIAWKEAVAFALVSGAFMGLARMFANREAAEIYKKATGHLPKDLLK